MMPDWLQLASRINPLSYEVNALRTLMIENGNSGFGLTTDFAVLSISALVLVVFGASPIPPSCTLRG